MITRRKLLSFASLVASPVLADEQLTRLALQPDAPKADAEGLRVAIVVGHNLKQGGAQGRGPIKAPEFPYWAENAECLVEALKAFGCSAQVYHRKCSSSYSHEIEECYARLYREMRPHAVLELHYNDGGSTKPHGSITLYDGSVKGSVLADACQRGMENSLSWGETDRRMSPWSRVVHSRGGRGYGAIKACAAPTVILEPAFAASSVMEAELLHAFGEQMLWAVAHQIARASVPLLA